MKIYLASIALAFVLPGAAHAATAPATAPKAEMRCCCEKMGRKMACCDEHMKKDKDGEAKSDAHKGHGGH